MPALLILLVVAVLAWKWFARRGSTLTRSCRWRLDSSIGPGHHACAACGAICDMTQGRAPRACLRASPDPDQQYRSTVIA